MMYDPQTHLPSGTKSHHLSSEGIQVLIRQTFRENPILLFQRTTYL